MTLIHLDKTSQETSTSKTETQKQAVSTSLHADGAQVTDGRSYFLLVKEKSPMKHETANAWKVA